MIPLYHDFTGETVLVFGGGPVGARKARRFAREATVVVISPAFPAEAYGDAERVRAAPAAEGVPGWFERVEPALAIAATDDPGVNEAIESTARTRGVLVNRTDRSGRRDAGSVVVPATVRDEDVVVAVSTGGRSPALAKELRERIEDEIDGADELAELTAEIRTSLQERGVDPALRRRAVGEVVRSKAVWKDLGKGDSNPRQTADAVVEAALGDRT
ncbi:bifunctional precorrin-2 dehydrogenase/sirohydrochlorin ferrochelatase [Natronomonas sp. F2-12]|uniref:precorrin-2 dehydrogenase n=1 Tax=Natronomonas aquatica TaxID=2841590 RepID=A0A9R1CU20_9EURY|nr:bifunctional precorrin-2 dehydrogenase/sirohydrochlorin ferrochelatase [Natronomonas aquatica]MCQ4333792.1 bifunctional precorrin-2 dehydrogenase/sirohydrochlorin ferrochelatase [Natronomonas aquatica]